jgi:hypothetical protein
MPETFNSTVLTVSDSGLMGVTKQPSNNWRQWTKAGLVFAGTVGTFLALRTTGSFGLISSWLKRSKNSAGNILVRITANSIVQNQINPLVELPLVSQKTERNPSEILQKIGAEFQVNTYTLYQQCNPSVARLSNGGFVVAWTSGLSTAPELSQDGNGYGIFGQMYHANGTRDGNEFQVNTHTIGAQMASSITTLSTGKFVIVWQSDGQDGDGYGIYGQMFNADGSKYSTEFQVNTYTADNQAGPSVAGLSDGKFVVVWQSDEGVSSWTDIYRQLYNDDGTKYGTEFRVNTYTTNAQGAPSVAGLSDGKFVVTWRGNVQDGDEFGIFGQMYYNIGGPYGNEFQVNTYTTRSQNWSSTASLNDGKFVVTWESLGQDGNFTGIYGQMYYANDTRYGSEFQVNTYTTDYQMGPSVAGLSNGKFVVTWSSRGQVVGIDNVYGQMYYANGTCYGDEFQVPTNITKSNGDPSITCLSDDEFVVVWSNNGIDGSLYGVYGQIFSYNFTSTSIPISSSSSPISSISSLSSSVTNTSNTTFSSSYSSTPINPSSSSISNISSSSSSGGSSINSFSSLISSIFSLSSPITSTSSTISPSSSITSAISSTSTNISSSAQMSDVGNSDSQISSGSESDRSNTTNATQIYTSSSSPYVQSSNSAMLVESLSSVEVSGGNLATILPAILGSLVAICGAIGGGLGIWKYRKGKQKLTEAANEDIKMLNIKIQEDKDEPSIVSQVHEQVKPAPKKETLLSSDITTVTESEDKQTKRKLLIDSKTMMDDKGRMSLSYRISHRDLQYNESEKLGQGGFGMVYHGMWRNYTEVAIKQLHVQQMSKEMLDGFKKEASMMASLHHPNIVHLFGVCMKPGYYSMVMEYFPRGSLDKVLRSEESLTWGKRWEIAYDVGCGLSYLHDNNILHRDLKSSNILLDHQMRAKLSDFGLSRVKTESAAMTRQSVGTLPWMAPELFESGVEYTPKADIYSYGIILWELSSRQKPFDKASEAQIIGAVTSGQRLDIPEDCPHSMAKLMGRCWAQEPKQRPKIEEVVDELKADKYSDAESIASTDISYHIDSSPSYQFTSV